MRADARRCASLRHVAFLMVVIVVLAGCGREGEKEEDVKRAAPSAAKQMTTLDERVDAAVVKASEFLLAQQQEDGSWGHPGVTAIAVRALLGCSVVRNGSKEALYSSAHPKIKKALDYILSLQKPDGAIYGEDMPNYVTAIAITAFVAANDEEYGAVINKARDYLVGGQYGEEEDDEWANGGFGYGSKGPGKPDLSNVQLALEALHDAKLPKDDPAWQRAVIFLQRCQNRSESNDRPWAANDGGFVYSPMESKAGEYTLADGRTSLRSYGSMTYAGLKSFIYADVDRADPRVQAALRWIGENYTLEENPSMGQEGLYYYYQTMAKALAAYGADEFVDSGGVQHNWRRELQLATLQRQNPDGYWINSNPRWWESDKALVTSYVLLVMEYTRR